MFKIFNKIKNIFLPIKTIDNGQGYIERPAACVRFGGTVEHTRMRKYSNGEVAIFDDSYGKWRIANKDGTFDSRDVTLLERWWPLSQQKD